MNNLRKNDFLMNTFQDISKLQGNLISVDGNIGTGKSTLLKIFQEFQGDGQSYIAKLEPIDKWSPWFEKFLEGMDYVNTCAKKKKVCAKNCLKNPYLCPFQIKILISYYHLLINIPYTKNIICERTPFTSLNIFSKMALDDNTLDIDEFHLIEELYQLIGWKAKYQIYISCLPKNSFDRIKKRSRKGEDKYSLQYIESLHKQHEKIFNPSNYQINKIKPGDFVNIDDVFIINGNHSADSVADAAIKIHKYIETIQAKQNIRYCKKFKKKNNQCQNQKKCQWKVRKGCIPNQ